MPASLSILAQELAQLAPDDRQAILAALSFEERQRVRDAGSSSPARTSTPRTEAGDHSPWFQSLVAPSPPGDPVGAATTAAQTALLEVIDAKRAQAPELVASQGRSLIQAAGGFLSPGKTRR